MPWFSHCFATIENFCLVFLQWLNKTKNQKTKKPKKQKKQEKQNDKTQLSATTTPLGVCNLVFLDFWFFWFLGFLVSCVLLRSWFLLQWLNKTKNQKNRGPDNPTRQLLPRMSTKCCSGDGERRKDKGGGGGPRSKTKLCVTKLYVKDGCVCDKVVCERWCVTKKDGVCV